MSRALPAAVIGCCLAAALFLAAGCSREQPPRPSAPAPAMSFEESKIRVFELVQALAKGLRPASGTQPGEYFEAGCVEQSNSMGFYYTGPPYAARYTAYLKYSPETAAEITRRVSELAKTGWTALPESSSHSGDPGASSPDGTWVRVSTPSSKTAAEALARPTDEPANWYFDIAIRAGGPCVE